MIDFAELPKDGVKFEQLVRELLVRLGFEVHWTGVGPDDGRDLVVTETAQGKLAAFKRRWLVSCKHNANSGKSVGVADVSSLYDSCQAVGAGGFLLVCSTQPSASLMRRFQEIEAKGKIAIRYWDGIELGKRLMDPAALPLVHLFFPSNTSARSWHVYGTSTPSLWAANYKDYFLYLVCRYAHSFSHLEDAEAIVSKLESVPLPKGLDSGGRHFLRPRAIYFDERHDQFTVFADYIYPSGRESVPDRLTTNDLNRVLQNGQGLYSDKESMWYLTFWDIRFVECIQGESFHTEAREYYEPYLRNFHVGASRGPLLGEVP